jgi:hypothetical protein
VRRKEGLLDASVVPILEAVVTTAWAGPGTLCAEFKIALFDRLR